MDLILAWGVFPLLLGSLCGGAGLLTRRTLGDRLPAPLIPAAGFATIVIAGEAVTLSDATAGLATPLLAGLAIGGLALSGSRLRSGWSPRLGRPAAAAVAVFAVYAAPIILSGTPTFAGYIKLDDTATWMALTDRVIEHGRSLDGLAPSTYEATLALNLGDGYPVGAFIPLGAASALVGQDVAWTIQPYMAFLAAMLALALYQLAGELVGSPRLRALAAFVAAQPALLVGYYLWGGIKEVAAAALIAAGAALAARAIRRPKPWGTVASLALLTAALIGTLSAGGLVWLLPALVAALIASIRALGPRPAAVRGGAFAALTGVLSLPVIVAGGLLPATSAPLTEADALGNLLRPLDPLQVAGIWPAGDFRLGVERWEVARVLLAAALLSGALGIAIAWRRRAGGPLLYVAGTLAACLAICAFGSPWVDAKALAIASPAIPLAAALAAGSLWAIGRPLLGGIVVGALLTGVLWSNGLAYREVSLAPRDQLAELEEIGERISGQGPTLMTEYNPYGTRHFLREADPEGASELRRRLIPLRTGTSLRKGFSADTDQFSLPDLLVYRTLVLRRSPAQSRPPAAYDLVWSGSHYEVWQRIGGAPPRIAHLPLGDRHDPVGRPPCGKVLELAEGVAPSEQLLAAVRRPPVVVPPSTASHEPGSIKARVGLPRQGEYELWLGGSVRGEAEVLIDGRPAGSVRHRLNNRGQYVQLALARLGRGPHRIEVRYGGPDLHPGSGGVRGSIGPLALSSSGAAQTRLQRLPPSRARQLCGHRFDWIEAASG